MGIICKVNNHKGIIEIFNKLKIKKKNYTYGFGVTHWRRIAVYTKFYILLWIWCHPLEMRVLNTL